MTKENITIYIDAANLILGIRNFFQIELDMYQLCLYFQERYRANKCIYFTAKIPGLVNEFDKLKTCGVEIVFKEMYFENGKTKANCDVEIAHRITQDVENGLVDKLIFVSGDGDFVGLLNYVKSKNKEVILYAPHRKGTSKMLRNNKNFNLTYVSQILQRVGKRKGLAGHVASERLLFVNKSITPTQNLSSLEINIKPFEVLNEKVLFEIPKRYQVIGAELKTPENKITNWTYFKMKELVIVLALDKNKNVFLKTEWRLNRKDFLTEVVSGFVEHENPTEEQILETVNKELQEEVGYKSSKITKLKTLYLFNHLSSKAHFFLAQDLEKSSLEKDENELLDNHLLPFDQAYEFVLNKQIPNAQVQIIFDLVKNYLNKIKN